MPVPPQVLGEKGVHRQTQHTAHALRPEPGTEGADSLEERANITVEYRLVNVCGIIARIPREQFVASVSGENHADVAARQLGDKPLRNNARTCARLVEMIEDPRQQ